MRAKAALAYLPLIGWFFTVFVFPDDDELIRYHSRQGFGAAVVFVIAWVLVWLVSHTIPSFLSLVEWALFAGVAAVYLYLLVRGGVAAWNGKREPLPFFGERLETLPL
jgi:uncharacterized membrane protein